LPPFIAPASSSVTPKPAHQPQRLEEAQLTGFNRRIAVGGAVATVLFAIFIRQFFLQVYIYIYIYIYIIFVNFFFAKDYRALNIETAPLLNILFHFLCHDRIFFLQHIMPGF
jgi:hypothetical protein